MLGIFGAILLGAAVLIVATITIVWLTNRIKLLLQNRRAKKVIIEDIDRAIKECDNEEALFKVKEMKNKGVALLSYSVDENNNIIESEAYQDKNSQLDNEVDELLGKERMVVVVK